MLWDILVPFRTKSTIVSRKKGPFQLFFRFIRGRTQSSEPSDCYKLQSKWGVSLNGGTKQPWSTMGFPTKNDHFGVFGGYYHFRKHPNGRAGNSHSWTKKKQIPHTQLLGELFFKGMSWRWRYPTGEEILLSLPYLSGRVDDNFACFSLFRHFGMFLQESAETLGETREASQKSNIDAKCCHV